MNSVLTQVLSTVNAPYGANLSAHELAVRIADPESANAYDASVFAFFSEVSAALQDSFIEIMGVDKTSAKKVAKRFAAMSGFPLALAA